MGQYFIMSRKFSKQTLGDFGLIKADNGDYAIHPKDNSRWMRCSFYDLGWGNETGYYRVPLPCCSELLRILIESNDFDDVYGAAAIVIEKYPNDLLKFCEELFVPPINKVSAEKVVKILHLDQCINRSSIHGKSYEEITNDFTRWEAVSKKAQRLIKQPLMQESRN